MVRGGGVVWEGLVNDVPRLHLVRGMRNNTGLNNCFLNVVIQSLWHLRAFREALLALHHEVSFHVKGIKFMVRFPISMHLVWHAAVILCRQFHIIIFIGAPALDWPWSQCRFVCCGNLSGAQAEAVSKCHLATVHASQSGKLSSVRVGRRLTARRNEALSCFCS